MQTQNNCTFTEIQAALKNGKKFFVAGHQNPDGDSLGCTLAVCSLLKRMGKEVYAYSNDRAGDDLAFLPGMDSIHFGVLPQVCDFDSVILLECSDRQRGGNLEDILENAKTVINIDHHITGERYGTLNYIAPHASSTAEIITQLFEFMEETPTDDEATCLYTGLVTDTARFLHNNTTAESLCVGAVLVSSGADIQKINTVIFNTKPFKELKLQGRALEKLNLLDNDKTAEITITKQDFEDLGVDPQHVQGIVSLPVMIPSVEVSVLFRQEPSKVAVNLRSKGTVDVSALAQKFGGGGHARAAGFKLEGADLDIVKKDLLERIRQALSNI